MGFESSQPDPPSSVLALLYDCGQKSDPSASCPCLHACHVSLLRCHLESRAAINSIFFQQVSLDHVVSSPQQRVGGTLRKTKLNSTQGKLEEKEMCSFMAYGLHGVWSQQCQHLNVPLAPKAMLLNTQLNSLIATPLTSVGRHKYCGVWINLSNLWKEKYFFFVVGAEFSLNSECLKAY